MGVDPLPWLMGSSDAADIGRACSAHIPHSPVQPACFWALGYSTTVQPFSLNDAGSDPLGKLLISSAHLVASQNGPISGELSRIFCESAQAPGPKSMFRDFPWRTKPAGGRLWTEDS